jgi:hypothetical protein
VRGPPQGEALPGFEAKSVLAGKVEIVTVAELLLVTVTVLLALVEPTAVLGNDKLAGLKLSGGVLPPVPLPERATICRIESTV